MNEHFSVTPTSEDRSTVVLCVKGSLDARNTLALTQRCAAVQESGRHLVLNLARVDFLASSGIGALLALTEEFDEAGFSMRISASSEVVRAAIALLNLDTFLKLYDSDDDALRGLAA